MRTGARTAPRCCPCDTASGRAEVVRTFHSSGTAVEEITRLSQRPDRTQQPSCPSLQQVVTICRKRGNLHELFLPPLRKEVARTGGVADALADAFPDFFRRPVPAECIHVS